MIYAMADLHGCAEQYFEMLRLIRFSEEDTLYILGDVIDRGEGGIKILLDMMRRPNVVFLAGNHEQMAVKVMKEIGESPPGMEDIILSENHLLWMINGGDPTKKAFCALDRKRQQEIIEYILSAPLIEEIDAGGRHFHLSHALPQWNEAGLWEEAPWSEYLWGEPDYDKVYREGTWFVTGHIPTGMIDPEMVGRIIQKNNHIAIDCGAVFDETLGCICLDTMEEFYPEGQEEKQ